MTKVGVIGAGGMGNVHTRKYLQMKDVEVQFFEVSPERREAFAATHKIGAVGSLDQLVQWADALDICLPTDRHLEVALQTISAKKPTLIEKPMASDVAQCRAIRAAEKEHGTMVMPGQVVRFFPEFERAHQLVKQGKVGKPSAIRMRRGGKAPTGSEGWFQDLERSGGVLLDVAVHEFDWVHWTFGLPKTVTARSVRWSQPSFNQPGDYALTTIEFESGCLAHIESTWLDPSGFRATIEVCGSEGMISYDSRNTPSVRTALPSGNFNEGPVDPNDDPYFRQLSAFVGAVQTGGPSPIPTEDGEIAVAIARAAIESAKTGQVVDFREFYQ